jgi:hypothetical protein
MRDRTVDTAFLYVELGGKERWYKPRDPKGERLVVDLVRSKRAWVERTYTRLLFHQDDLVAHHATVVRPRGEDWQMIGVDGSLAVWQRSKRSEIWDEERVMIDTPRKEIV